MNRKVVFVCRIPRTGVLWNYDTQTFDWYDDALLVADWRPYLPPTDIRDFYRIFVQAGMPPLEAMEEMITEKWYQEYDTTS